MKTLFYSFFIIFIVPLVLVAQVVTSIPAFPTVNDSVIVIFDASKGDKGLQGFTGDIYAHTGVITNKSTSPSDWKYVIAPWNVNLSKAKLIRKSGDSWQLNIGKIREYYGITDLSEKVLKLAFVFRNNDGSKTGRDTDGKDIFLDIYELGITVSVIEPKLESAFTDLQRSPVFVGINDTLRISAITITLGTQISSMRLIINNNEVIKVLNDTLNYKFVSKEYGLKKATIIGTDVANLSDTTLFYIMVNPPVINQTLPQGIVDGINYVNNTTVTFSLFTPYKKFVYLIGDFNDWKIDTTYYMKRHQVDNNNAWFWITISNLDANTEYAFQYLVDGKIRVGDPYTEKILDPWNDGSIPQVKEYPKGKTAEIVSTFKINQEQYAWQVTNFQRPAKEKLIIYELLVRDFISAHNYKTLVDTLNYLQRLGVNAIELMPVNEFEGNNSWGYNPSFHLALDKYYGTKNDLKRFIDECHKRGIAVILDVVLNHAFGHSPLVRLYNVGGYAEPTSENPWLNVKAKHPFNVGYDFNHESLSTKYFVDRVTSYWIKEYKVDGYRFDLSKGFSQRDCGNDLGCWNSYDASRIAIWKRIADKIWAIDPNFYVILEHFAVNTEEKELADYGMMLWGNLNYNYNEATMGWHSGSNSDFSWGFYKHRGWTKPHVVTYMESHDEERLMFKNIQYGNSSGNYNVKDTTTALNRIKMAGAFFFTFPGPKMIWQFGELGYDYSIDYNGRVGEKPIRWDYLNKTERKKLYKTFSTLIKLRNEQEAFTSTESTLDYLLHLAEKRINITHSSMKVTIIGNFGVASSSVSPNFQNTGKWYDYFSGDSMQVTDVSATINLRPGEFHIYTTKRLPKPEEGLVTDVENKQKSIPYSFELYQNYPNPFNPHTKVRFSLAKNGKTTLKIYDILGREIRTLLEKELGAGLYEFSWNGKNNFGKSVASGIYFYKIKSGNFVNVKKMVLLR